jgi:hypothetical protein
MITADPLIGSELLGLRVEEVVGRGGMGVVYRAHDLTLDRTVALKLIAPELAADVDFRDRFLTESRLAAAVEHPNVIPIHSAGEADGRLYLVMRYVEGRDLRAVLQDGPIDPARTIAICDQVAKALDAAHLRGLVHRDVKPSNILLDTDGHAYLVDFGLTRRLADEPSKRTAHSIGTADYVAPEQIKGEAVDGRADVYSLGCVLYECLTGEPPFAGQTEMATLFAHLEDPPPAPEGLESVFERALAKSPDDRYCTSGDLVVDARRALRPRRRRRVWLTGALGAAVAVVAAVVLIGATGGSRHPAPAPPKPITTGLFHINSTNGKTRAIPVPGSPDVAGVTPGIQGVERGLGSVWVTTTIGLEQLDPANGHLMTPVSLPDGGNPMAESPGRIYVTGRLEHRRIVQVISPADPGPYPDIIRTERWNKNQDPSYIAVGRGSLWVWEAGFRDAGSPHCCDGRVFWRIDPITHRVLGRWPNPTTVNGSYFVNGNAVAVGSKGVWLTRHGRLLEIDLRTKGLMPAVPHLTATAVAEGDGTVWALGTGGVVAEINPTTDTVEWARTFPSATFHDIVVGDGAVWIEDERGRRILRIETTGRHQVSWISVPYPQGPRRTAKPLGPMVVGPGGLWVAFPQAPFPGA